MTYNLTHNETGTTIVTVAPAYNAEHGTPARKITFTRDAEYYTLDVDGFEIWAAYGVDQFGTERIVKFYFTPDQLVDASGERLLPEDFPWDDAAMLVNYAIN